MSRPVPDIIDSQQPKWLKAKATISTTCFKFCGINVDSNDATSTSLLTAHDGSQADGAESEYCTVGTGFHLRRVQCRSVPCWDAAAKQTDFVQPRTAIHLQKRSQSANSK